MRTDSEAQFIPVRSAPGSVKRHRAPPDSSSIVAAATGPIIRGQLSPANERGEAPGNSLVSLAPSFPSYDGINIGR